MRYVRTEEGAKRYGVPIGSPIPKGKAKAAAEDVAHKAKAAASPRKARAAAPNVHTVQSVRKLTAPEQRRASQAIAGFEHHPTSVTTPKRLHPDAVAAFHDIASAMREGRDHGRVAKIDAAMEPTTHDLVGTRNLPVSAFGRRDITGLAGKKITDKAYTPAALHQEPQPGGVTMHISVPRVPER